MKTISIPAQAAEVNALLEQAREEDVLVRSADGTEFIVTEGALEYAPGVFDRGIRHRYKASDSEVRDGAL